MWHEGRNSLVCTASEERVDVAVESDGELGAVVGDAYLDSEPLTPSALRSVGPDFDRVNGEFLGVLESEDRLRVVTDRLNFQQLFVYETDDLFVGATSVLGVLHYLADVDRLDVTLNRTAMTEALNFGYPLEEKTHFEEVNLLPAATVTDVELTDDGLRRTESTYWEMEYGDYYDDVEEAADDLTEAMREAMELRTDDDHHYGIHLSGGLDSRLILAAMPKTARTTAYSFGVSGSDEPFIARLSAMASHADFEFFPLGQYLTEYAEEGIRLTDGTVPMNNFHHLPSMHEMRDDCDKLFLGSLGDITLAGSKLTPQMLTESFGPDDIYKKTDSFEENLWNDLLDQEYFDRSLAKESVARSYGRTSPESNHCNRIDIWNIASRQARYIFRGGPRSIGHFVPVSNPFADKRVLEVSLRISPEMRLENDFRHGMLGDLAPKQAWVPEAANWTPPAVNKLKYGPGGVRFLLSKRRFRRAVPFLGDEIPFGYPDYEEWVRTDGELRSFVIDKLDRFCDRGWADHTAVTNAMAAHCARQGSYWRELFSMVTQEIWLEAVESEFPGLEFGPKSEPVTA
ncbi:asparagine synthase-related protein [Halogeometricum limi]|uniref:asparagine synthase-related protein n=1 Tax=Halogeometricum limi TaxID=555875 RepID=UPI001113F817|nr:asparagine synthase-related protein [Halogeometricum limi]